jgi:hypothetical protein
MAGKSIQFVQLQVASISSGSLSSGPSIDFIGGSSWHASIGGITKPVMLPVTVVGVGPVDQQTKPYRPCVMTRRAKARCRLPCCRCLPWSFRVLHEVVWGNVLEASIVVDTNGGAYSLRVGFWISPLGGSLVSVRC